MVSDMFINIIILVSFIFVISQIFKKYSFKDRLEIGEQVILGVIYGILGITLLLYSIEVTDTARIDLRQIAIVSAGIIGGPLSTVVSAVIIGASRILLFGISKASIAGCISALTLGAVCAWLSSADTSRLKKYMWMYLFSMLTTNSAFVYLIKDQRQLFQTLLYLWPTYLLGTTVTYFALEYVIHTNSIFKTMEYHRIMADNLWDMVATHKLDCTYKYVSPSSMHLLGYMPDELVGMEAPEFIHPDDISIVKEAQSDILKGQEVATCIFRMKRKSGEYVWVESTIKGLKNADGTLKEIICVTRDVTTRKQVEEELKRAKLEAEKAASIDYLTGVLNRRAFIGRFNEEFIRTGREKSSISLILTDIDYFKEINDTYGHQVGDLALQKFSECISSCCRPYDFIGRQGGEEFIICLPSTDCEQAKRVAERMRNKVEKLVIELEGVKEPIRITASFGVASPISGNEENIDELIKQADDAMYKAKEMGRNHVCTACEPKAS